MSGPGATWVSMSGFPEILAALRIPPDVTERWRESMIMSRVPWQPEMLQVLEDSDQDSKQVPAELGL